MRLGKTKKINVSIFFVLRSTFTIFAVLRLRVEESAPTCNISLLQKVLLKLSSVFKFGDL